jgi:F0F1-type ATP synthase membrane subunit b/b'
VNARRAWTVTASGIAALALIDAAMLRASEGAAEEHHPHEHAPSIGELLFPAINFAIFAVIIVKYVVPALREYLRGRARDISDATAVAGVALADAEAAMSAVRGRHASVAADRATIEHDIVAAARRQAERLLQQAEETGKRRVADAVLVGAQERRRALDEVRAEVAALATDLAQARLRSMLSADDQRASIQRFLEEAPSR